MPHATAPEWPHRCDDCGRPVSTKDTVRCHPCNGARHAKAAVTCPSCGGPKDRQSRRCMSCKRGSVLVEQIERSGSADECRIEVRRRLNRDAMDQVDLAGMRRDLLLADRPFMRLEVERMAQNLQPGEVVFREWG